MLFKTDTKEKFTVLTILEKEITANMSADFKKIMTENLKKQPPHLIINFQEVSETDSGIFELLLEMHEQYYSDNHSFVICAMNEAITKKLMSFPDIADLLNLTPTESEAWDIVQMEEIERELMQDFDESE